MESAIVGNRRTQVCTEMCDGSHRTQSFTMVCALGIVTIAKGWSSPGVAHGIRAIVVSTERERTNGIYLVPTA